MPLFYSIHFYLLSAFLKLSKQSIKQLKHDSSEKHCGRNETLWCFFPLIFVFPAIGEERRNITDLLQACHELDD